MYLILHQVQQVFGWCVGEDIVIVQYFHAHFLFPLLLNYLPGFPNPPARVLRGRKVIAKK